MQVAFVAPDDWTVWLFYRHLIQVLVEAGARISVFSAPGPYLSRLRDLGVDHTPVPYARFVDPVRDLQLCWCLLRAFRARRFDVVQNFTIKANLFGALAARAAGVRHIINTVEGAGLLYSGVPDLRVRAVRALAEVGLRRVRSHVFRYWFVNRHDRDVFVARRLATANRSVVAIATGVDTQRFDPRSVSPETAAAFRTALGMNPELPLVAMVAGRLLRSKGVVEFIQMARRLRQNGINAEALLVGPVEPGNLDALPRTLIESAQREGVLHWIPFREDIWTVYAASTVVVVPTYYAEGTPKGVMEGMAMERAVISSDLPSTRELITDGRDGILIPARDVDRLVTAVVDLLRSPWRRAELGCAARRIAVARFDARRAAQSAVAAVYAALPNWPPSRKATM